MPIGVDRGLSMVSNGEICDAKTMISILLFASRGSSLGKGRTYERGPGFSLDVREACRSG